MIEKTGRWRGLIDVDVDLDVDLDLDLERFAAGSANEVRLALRIAVSWGILARSDADAAQSLVKRVLSMLWKLTH